MSNANPLAGLVANYGDSEEESDGGDTRQAAAAAAANSMAAAQQASAAIHPAPIPHCPWSACYDESSGFTYYWNQVTNEVTWEAPPAYLLALKLAQQQLHASGVTPEVSAEEWQIYQQALVEKQIKAIAKSAVINQPKLEPQPDLKEKKRPSKKRMATEEEEKIELITSYHNSDSESNDEADIPPKPIEPLPPAPVVKPKNPHKKQKTKPVEFGPTLPPNQEYTTPIGPELPPEMINPQEIRPKTPESKGESDMKIEPEVSKTKTEDNEDSQDENTLFQRLKDKAKLLEKLGGELPSELQKIIEEEGSMTGSPKSLESRTQNSLDIDDLLEEIEKKELPKIKSKSNKDRTQKSNSSSVTNSPLRAGEKTPPIEEVKPLFPSSKAITEEPTSLFPSAAYIDQPKLEPVPMELDVKEDKKKNVNIYLNDTEVTEHMSKKKLRISNSVLPERKQLKFDATAYTTKYAQYVEGFSGERVGLGFTKEDSTESSPKNTISYGNGLTFTKGEVLNEDKKEEDLDDLADLVEAKLKYLNQLQPCVLTPVQEMLIQLQTLVAAFRAGALAAAYWRRWGAAAARALRAHEAAAAPPGWTCAFLRSEGRYRYRREADGLEQWEYPAVTNTDMDISTTPPHPGVDSKEEATPPLPPTEPPCPPFPPCPPCPPCPPPRTPPPPPAPVWIDPPPPGIDDPPPPPPPPISQEPKAEIGDELLSFYNDIAELEKNTSNPPTERNSPEPPPPPVITDKERLWEREREKEKEKEREKEKDKEGKVSKKKAKVKISSSVGLKHKTVSSMVAKWQQVASEIDSD